MRGHSQLVADGDEGDEEEGRRGPDVLEREGLLVRVAEGEVLVARQRPYTVDKEDRDRRTSCATWGLLV